MYGGDCSEIKYLLKPITKDLPKLLLKCRCSLVILPLMVTFYISEIFLNCMIGLEVKAMKSGEFCLYGNLMGKGLLTEGLLV